MIYYCNFRRPPGDISFFVQIYNNLPNPVPRIHVNKLVQIINEALLEVLYETNNLKKMQYLGELAS